MAVDSDVSVCVCVCACVCVLCCVQKPAQGTPHGHVTRQLVDHL